MQQQLPNNCTLYNISVAPENWQDQKAKLDITWEISYRFKEGNQKKPRQKRTVVPKKYRSWLDKKFYVENYLKNVRQMVEQGINPITKEYFRTAEIPLDVVAVQRAINSSMTIIDAIEYAYKKLNCVKAYQDNVKWMKNYFIAVIRKQNMAHVAAKDFDELYIKHTLEQCGKEKIRERNEMTPKELKRTNGEPWNNNRYNYWLALLNSLMLILEDERIIPRVFTKGVKRLKKTDPTRKVITAEERQRLHVAYKEGKMKYEEWRYYAIFRPAMRRHAEMLRLRKEDIKLDIQKFTVKQLKGKSYKYVPVTINDNVLNLWKELYEAAKPGQFIFSKGLKPGDVHINPNQIARRWKKLSKKKLGIAADSYTLKHSALDELAAKFNLEEAKKAAGHSSIVTTMGYTKGEEERRHERMKKVNIKL